MNDDYDKDDDVNELHNSFLKLLSPLENSSR